MSELDALLLAQACFALARADERARAEGREITVAEVHALAEWYGPTAASYALRVKGEMELAEADALEAHAKARRHLKSVT